jgi:hypothetical protein
VIEADFSDPLIRLRNPGEHFSDGLGGGPDIRFKQGVREAVTEFAHVEVAVDATVVKGTAT